MQSSPKLRHVLTAVLDCLMLVALFLYMTGGVEFHGKLRLTYIADFFTIIAVFYAACKLSVGLRMRDTRVGGGLYEFADAMTHWPLRARLSPMAYLVAIAFGLTLVSFIALPLINHWALVNQLLDLGIFENAIFNASRTGHFWTYVFTDGRTPLEYVPHNHLNLGLILFALIYKLAPFTEILLVAQSLALLSSVIPLYKLSKKILPTQVPPWLIVLAFLFWDANYRLNIWDFHEQGFIIPLCLWAFYFIEVGKLWRAILFMVLMALWREDAWWTLSAMVFYMGIRSKRWGMALPAMILGALIFPLHAALLNQVNHLSDRYPYFGNSFVEAARTVFHNPGLLFKVAWENRLFFGQLILRTGGGLFLLGGWPVLAVFPTLAEVGLAKGNMLHWYHQYIGNFTAPLFYATLQAWKKIFEFFRSKSDLAWTIVSLSVALSFTQLSFNSVAALKVAVVQYRETQCLRDFIKTIPEDAPLITEEPLIASLTRREWIMWPDPTLDQSRAEYLVSKKKESLMAGLSGPQTAREVGPWEVVSEGCGFYMAKRRKTIP